MNKAVSFKIFGSETFNYIVVPELDFKVVNIYK